jgi:hypothetical protein
MMATQTSATGHRSSRARIGEEPDAKQNDRRREDADLGDYFAASTM